MAKHRDILGNEREIEDKTITISLEKYNTLIIKEAIADGLIQTKNKEKKLVQDTDELLEMYNDIVKELEKLKEYQQLEEQGTLIKLPFKAGDWVYLISENFIEPCTVEAIFLSDYMDKEWNHSNMAEIYYNREDCPYVSTEIYFTDIGKTVFLTESEAEAKLKDIKANRI